MVKPLSERIAEIQRRMELPTVRGNGWVRISAPMAEAHRFHRDWKEENSGFVRFDFGSHKFLFSLFALNKAIAWFHGNLDFERTGEFVGKRMKTEIQITDFIPYASYAVDSAIAFADPSTKQFTTSMGPNGILNIFEVEQALGIYDSRFEIPLPAGALFYSVHSHPAWSQFSRGPSPEDQKKAGNIKTLHFVFGLKEGVLSIFDGEAVENIFRSKTTPQIVENSI